ncbi:MAG TPA: tetratricopeptide repeat protein [Dissulfurispiraceae bacterium]|nr:tetratricopeptide repeat protein [Dissulfurispiraceae bacterium]
MSKQEEAPDYFAEGNEHLKAGRYKEAIEAYEAFLKEGESADVHNNLGLAHFQNGDLDTATKEFEKALTLAPDFAPAHANMGLALLNKKEFAEAVGPLEKALALDPNLAEANYNLGLALYRSGKVAEAIVAYERFIAEAPGSYKNYIEGVEQILQQLKKQQQDAS